MNNVITLPPQEKERKSQTQATVKCAHCGEVCPPARVPQVGAAFCCDGCETVYTLLRENDLCYYYQLDEHAGKKVNTKEETAYLDDPEIVRQIADFHNDEITVVTFEIPTMHCASCIWLLERFYRLAPGVLSSEVNFLRKECTIKFRNDRTSLAAVVANLYKIGYGPRLNLSQTQKQHADPQLRRLVYQLGVAGFCFGNIMLFSFPDYLGAVAEEHLRLFTYLSLLLALPLFFYSARDYFTTSFRALKAGKLVIEQPLALGMASMFFRSAFDIFNGTGTGFLDSLGGLIFFLLIAKFVQYKNYSFLSFERDYRAYFPLAATIKTEAGEKSVPITRVSVGQTLVVRHNEIIPADSVLSSPRAEIDYSFLTGEAEPVEITKGSSVFAGGKNAGPTAEFVAREKPEQSRLARLWDHPAFRKENVSELNIIINQINRYFTPVVIIIAVLSAAYWAPTDVGRALAAFTAVLIVACPCALALVTPFTNGHITRVLGRWGFYLRNSAVVERLAYINTLAFDKTGTLTDRARVETAFNSAGAPLTEDERKALAAAFCQTTHPNARAVAEEYFKYETLSDNLNVTNVEEIAGKGARVQVGTFFIEIGSARGLDVPAVAGAAVHFKINGVYRGYFVIKHGYRNGLQNVFAQLKKRFSLLVLSGDDDNAKKELQTLMGENTKLYFGQTPENKLTQIQTLQKSGARVAMIGDGLNDAGALRQSDAGISVTDDVSAFTPASDAILAAKYIDRLPEFLALCEKSKTVVKICFCVSLLYNLTGTYFAVRGELSPVIAAILMPFSSIGIISVATGLTYYYAKKLELTKENLEP